MNDSHARTAPEIPLPALPDHVTTSLREYRTARSDVAGDPQLEAVRLAVMIEEVADVVLSDDQIDPEVLADEASIATVVRTLRGAP